VSFERYASAGRALSESHFTMGIVHRSALTPASHGSCSDIDAHS